MIYFGNKLPNSIHEYKPGVHAYIVTDKGKAIVNAIRKHLRGVDVYRCWKHILSNVKFNLPKHDIRSQEDQDSYIQDVNGLIRKSSNEHYTKHEPKTIISIALCPQLIIIYFKDSSSKRWPWWSRRFWQPVERHKRQNEGTSGRDRKIWHSDSVLWRYVHALLVISNFYN